MSRREFTSQKALQDHAEQTDKVCVMEGIALRQRQLSPDQYEIVDVRTSRGVLRPALLIPKAVPESPVGGRVALPRGAGD
jgi:hypothetical protein